MKIFKGIRASWRRLAAGRPGSRFEGYYRSQQEGRSPARRVVSILAGLVLVAGGLVLLPAPGPGMLVVALGFGLLAREFRSVARALDRLEPNVRRSVAAAARLWRRSSPLGRAALVFLALVLASGVALGGYRLVLAD